VGGSWVAVGSRVGVDVEGWSAVGVAGTGVDVETTRVGEGATAVQLIINSTANIMNLRRIFILSTTFSKTNDNKKKKHKSKSYSNSNEMPNHGIQASKNVWLKTNPHFRRTKARNCSIIKEYLLSNPETTIITPCKLKASK